MEYSPLQFSRAVLRTSLKSSSRGTASLQLKTRAVLFQYKAESRKMAVISEFALCESVAHAVGHSLPQSVLHAIKKPHIKAAAIALCAIYSH